ncbi:hypothetical protein [Ferrovibrio xuzhouensis]|uniref:DUF2306 domain-containing protein n=1 Tax=Ferrovibrio xuzhouensis TaxID=1576914 RepID=A0ABV7VBP4_9PROT
MPIDILLPAHTAVSIIAILIGIPVVAGLLRGRDRPALTAVFLAAAFITSASGFLFPFFQLLPSHVIGAIALLVLAVTVPARRRWPRIHAAGLVASLYLLSFVGIAQAFAKIPALNAIAPGHADWPFQAAQVFVLMLFVGLGIVALRRVARPSLA